MTTFLIATILSTFGFTAVFLYLAAVVFLAGVCMQAFGERTRGRSLEQISVGDSQAGATAPERTQTISGQIETAQ